MGGCTSCNKGLRTKTECKFCSTTAEDRDKSSTKCQHGHTVCQMCIIKTNQGELRCPHCQVKIIQSKPAESTYHQAEHNHKNHYPSHNVEEQYPTTIQHHSLQNKQQVYHSTVQPAIIGAAHDESKIKQVPQPMKQSLFQQDKKVEQNEQIQQPAKPTANDAETNNGQQKPFQKKVCGCSIQNFLVVIVLIVQSLFTAASMYYSFSQPKSECMDVSHSSFLPPIRPLMEQVSGIETAITLIMSVSAFIYKRGCLSEPIFDNWMIFLKFILSTKQLLWTAIQTVLQVVIMPLYCDPGIMRLTLITSVGNLISFLMVIIKPVYTCFSEKCCKKTN